VLNKRGNRNFRVEDQNGRNYTKYIAKISGTETTYAMTTNTKRVR
jgi:hypothetical protein